MSQQLQDEQDARIEIAKTNIAAAAFLGWTHLIYQPNNLDPSPRGVPPEPTGKPADYTFEHDGIVRWAVPSFDLCLNAAAEIERRFTDEQHAVFRRELLLITSEGKRNDESRPTYEYENGIMRAYASATAAQRLAACRTVFNNLT